MIASAELCHLKCTDRDAVRIEACRLPLPPHERNRIAQPDRIRADGEGDPIGESCRDAWLPRLPRDLTLRLEELDLDVSIPDTNWILRYALVTTG